MKKIKFFLLSFLLGTFILMPKETLAASKVKECMYGNYKISIYNDSSAEITDVSNQSILINWNRWIKDKKDITTCPKYIILTNPIEVGNQLEYIKEYATKHNAKYASLTSEKDSTDLDDEENSSDSLGAFGNKSDDNSVAWLLIKILGYVRIAGPVLVLILTTIDYLRALIQSDDETMSKINKKVGTRLLLIALLFLVPTLVTAILNIMGYNVSIIENLD